MSNWISHFDYIAPPRWINMNKCKQLKNLWARNFSVESTVQSKSQIIIITWRLDLLPNVSHDTIWWWISKHFFYSHCASQVIWYDERTIFLTGWLFTAIKPMKSFYLLITPMIFRDHQTHGYKQLERVESKNKCEFWYQISRWRNILTTLLFIFALPPVIWQFFHFSSLSWW